MLSFNIIIFLLFLSGYLISLKHKGEWVDNLDKKEYKLYFLYPMADWILTKGRLYNAFSRKVKISESMKALHITSKPEMLQKLYWCNKISLILAVILLFNFMSLLDQLQSVSNPKVLDNKYLIRPNYGEGNEEVELKVTMDRVGSSSSREDRDRISEDVKVKVKERTYSKGDLTEIYEKAFQYLEIEVLGNNEATDKIYEDLNFCKVIPGTSITVDWKPENYNLIHMDGKVSNEELASKGVKTSVTAVLNYQDEQTSKKMSFRIYPKKYSQTEIIKRKLENAIEETSSKTDEDSRMELPETLDDYHLSWGYKKSNTGIILFFLGILTAISVWLYEDKDLESKMKKRKEQMLLDYPEIINKFTLLLNAGMTVRQAWCKISEDYEKKYSGVKGLKHYAYEEMLVTVRELKLGLPENNSYEQYGRRVGFIPYIKFSSLIAQNLIKGNKGLLTLLSKEAMEAFEDRKELAKRLGEEAGTKLLAPMMLMLIIVFLIILIPAFRSFGM